MRRYFILLAVLIIFTSGFSIIPGLNKTNYGANAIIFPGIVYGMDAYYLEGMQIYSIKDVSDISLFTGIEFSATYVTLMETAGKADFTVGVPLKFVVPYKKFKIKLFDHDFYPALQYEMQVKYSSLSGFKFSADDFYVTLLSDFGNGKYVGIYFWPIPVVVGFDVIQY